MGFVVDTRTTEVPSTKVPIPGLANRITRETTGQQSKTERHGVQNAMSPWCVLETHTALPAANLRTGPCGRLEGVG